MKIHIDIDMNHITKNCYDFFQQYIEQLQVYKPIYFVTDNNNLIYNQFPNLKKKIFLNNNIENDNNYYISINIINDFQHYIEFTNESVWDNTFDLTICSLPQNVDKILEGFRNALIFYMYEIEFDENLTLSDIIIDKLWNIKDEELKQLVSKIINSDMTFHKKYGPSADDVKKDIARKFNTLLQDNISTIKDNRILFTSSNIYSRQMQWYKTQYIQSQRYHSPKNISFSSSNNIKSIGPDILVVYCSWMYDTENYFEFKPSNVYDYEIILHVQPKYNIDIQEALYAVFQLYYYDLPYNEDFELIDHKQIYLNEIEQLSSDVNIIKIRNSMGRQFYNILKKYFKNKLIMISDDKNIKFLYNYFSDPKYKQIIYKHTDYIKYNNDTTMFCNLIYHNNSKLEVISDVEGYDYQLNAYINKNYDFDIQFSMKYALILFICDLPWSETINKDLFK